MRKISSRFINEYKCFLENNVLKLLGINGEVCEVNIDDSTFYYVSFCTNTLFFGIQNHIIFNGECKNKAGYDVLSLLQNITIMFKIF